MIISLINSGIRASQNKRKLYQQQQLINAKCEREARETKAESDLMIAKREIEILKKENELLKKELKMLKEEYKLLSKIYKMSE